ncbi:MULTISPECIES: hypothetical protein [unclassified Streptomyces]|uniref:hypothetical protein n=1 Tax=unclassified Streptomyces TaxID=2593676 RepID=UPI0022510484|nr:MULTISPECIES: hypothetical protein [unclassified Streptomyces]MCX4990952.1 hypothetical protein [Streptomyces sp. NBC_00568]MCX5003817.1 hypothetical protein [Streptomyces sp. NBC_00638]
MGERIIEAGRSSGGVTLTTRDGVGRTREIETGRVLAATGYRVNLDALDFVAPEPRAELARTDGFPSLDAGLQSSVPGLYFTGIHAAATFGPPMRFTCGTQFAAPRLSSALAARL